MASTDDFNCVFCKEFFENKEDLQDHFRKHGDPKFNESLRSKTKFPNESQTCDKSNEDGEVVSCDVCTEMFPTISKAITHKHKVHPDHDAKYFCPWCGKLFTMKHLYNKHIQTNHESNVGSTESFHCDYCEVDFLIASAMVYHNKFFHRQDIELAAIGQSRKLKMSGEEPLQIYYCPFCGEEYCNKVNLHKHMGDDHSDENQSPDDVLRCPLCDAIFYHLDAYEVHLTFHSSEDLYSEGSEIMSEVVEFSLETVPPVMEKVENCESQEEAEATLNSIGIESFLQQAMNEENDNSNSEVVPGKKKKHKKHKKSKKSAITLDEFLNMNKDVFGEGIDFQGIEEVPTQVVAKQLKKLPLKPKSVSKLMPSTELDKLKKQGIVVKMKPGRNFNKLQGVRIGKEKPGSKTVNAVPNHRQHISPAKSNAISTSSDVLSKLLNQSNSQLKIVKKSAQDSLKSEEQDSVDTINTSTENKTSDNKECTELNLKESETKRFKTNEDMTSNSESDAINNLVEKQDIIALKGPEPVKDSLQDTFTKLDSPYSTENHDENIKFNNEQDDPMYDKPREAKNINILNEKTQYEKSDTNPTNTLNALRNISQHITIKSLSSPKSCLKPQNIYLKEAADDLSNIEDKGNSVTKESIESTVEKPENKCKNDSLNALKHLSHLITVKPANQSKPTSPIGAKKANVEAIVESKEMSHCDEMDIDNREQQTATSEQQQEAVSDVKQKPQSQKETPKSLNALKNLSKHITVKSVTSHTSKIIDRSYDNDKFVDETDDLDNDDETIKHETSSRGDNKNIISSNSRPTPTIELKSPEKRNSPSNQSAKIINKPVQGKLIRKPDEEHDLKDENIMKKQSCANILKQLPNVTAKPVNVVKNMQQVTTSIVKSSNQSINMRNSNVVQKCVKQEAKEEIEIFNVDDSDDEILNSQDSFSERTTTNSSVNKFTAELTTPVVESKGGLKNLSKQIDVKSKNLQNSPMIKELTSRAQMIGDKHDDFSTDKSDNDIANVKAIDAFKNFGKHITIKSTNHQKLSMNTDSQELMLEDGSHDVQYDELDIHNENMDAKSNNHKLVDKKNIMLQDKLKNLGKHITVKSTNSSSNTPVNPEVTHFKQNKLLEDFDSDSNSSSNRVQISEITDEYFSDNDFTSDQNKNECKTNKNMVIKFPDEPNSDIDHVSSDIESEIDSSTLQKSIPLNLDSLKSISRDIIIRTPKERQLDNLEEDNDMETDWEANLKIPNINNELSIKPLQQMKVVNQGDRNVFNANKAAKSTTMNQSAMNQRVSTSSGQVNTVNKEVSVKTFQTKTVIQEITTTVTKTIRTVNQSVKQEANLSQSFTPMMRPQKVQGMRANQQIRNYQGIPHRLATPSVGPRIRSPGPRSAVGTTISGPRSAVGITMPGPRSAVSTTTPGPRSAVGATIKPSNQLIPVRPGLNLTGTASPRMTVTKKTPPLTCNAPRPLGKPLKISPNAVMSATKRPNSEESSGPFSCFKKPKESLIPVPDVLTFNKNQDGETIQFASSSQMSRSNFSSTTRMVKGNSVMTSTHMKSEERASSEQLGRLSNMSGLKVVKTSQAKQASRVEENNCEISASKRTALEAIEKLQKQGLLVKKPRLDEDDYSDKSHSDGEDYIDT